MDVNAIFIFILFVGVINFVLILTRFKIIMLMTAQLWKQAKEHGEAAKRASKASYTRMTNEYKEMLSALHEIVSPNFTRLVNRSSKQNIRRGLVFLIGILL